MSLISGTKLGPYEVLAPLGAGGMSEVYKAKDTRLDRTVAIKVLPSHLSDNPQLKERFEREAARSLAKNHPNICTQAMDATMLATRGFHPDFHHRMARGFLPFRRSPRRRARVHPAP